MVTRINKSIVLFFLICAANTAFAENKGAEKLRAEDAVVKENMANDKSVKEIAHQERAIDPWSGFNRTMFSFNEALDENILLPVTKGYRAVVPDPVEKGVHNFFGNLGDVGTLFNSLFQLKFRDAAHNVSRITANTFFGIAGLIDVATPLGIEKKSEDFGQTLGYWGVDTGPYLVLPFFGPSNVRDGLSLLPDSYLDPITYVEGDDARFLLRGLRVVDMRSGLINAERLISGDRYSFMRDAYLQRREFLVTDGEIDETFDDDGF